MFRLEKNMKKKQLEVNSPDSWSDKIFQRLRFKPKASLNVTEELPLRLCLTDNNQVTFEPEVEFKQNNPISLCVCSQP